MEINVYVRNLDLNAEAESYIQKKFRRLERHLRALSDAKLELSRTSSRSQSDRVVAQMTLRTGVYTLRGQATTAAREDGLVAAGEPDAESEQEEASTELFLFHNVESGHHNVVYRRRDGDYGHIEPELT